MKFLSTLSLRRATFRFFGFVGCLVLFLSTLSLRRATDCQRPCGHPTKDFYPRSPCGERRRGGVLCYLDNIISIHALLAESDIMTTTICIVPKKFLSTLSLRRATKYVYVWYTILVNFYPRSPCGERRVFLRKITITVDISIHALLAESDQIFDDTSGAT